MAASPPAYLRERGAPPPPTRSSLLGDVLTRLFRGLVHARGYSEDDLIDGKTLVGASAMHALILDSAAMHSN